MKTQKTMEDKLFNFVLIKLGLISYENWPPDGG